MVFAEFFIQTRFGATNQNATVAIGFRAEISLAVAPKLLGITSTAPVKPTLKRIVVGIFWRVDITKKGNTDIHFGSPSLSNIRGQRAESGMWVDDIIANVVGLRPWSADFGGWDGSIVALSSQHGVRTHSGGNLIFVQDGQHSLTSQSHACFHTQQIRSVACVGTRRCCFTHPSTVFGNKGDFVLVRVQRFLFVQSVHDFGSPQAQAKFFVGLVNVEDTIFNLITPQ
mmetsp:Transcript_12907/g.28335  ORF Transcript_12907/g.28335 Transcript_12907/m.28335 type:complete len:227 (+) Transcript_12907:1992-2672(+)